MHCNKCFYRHRIKHFGGDVLTCPKCGHQQANVPEESVKQSFRRLPKWILILVVLRIGLFVGGVVVLWYAARAILGAMFPPFWPA